MKKLNHVFFLIIIFFIHSSLFSNIYCRIEGIVKDKDTGLPLENVKINLFKTNSIIGGEFYGTRTNQNGLFIFKKVVADNYFFICEKSGYVPNVNRYLIDCFLNDKLKMNQYSLSLKRGQFLKLEIYLERGGTIEGLISEKSELGESGVKQVSFVLSRKIVGNELLNCPISFSNNYILVTEGETSLETPGYYCIKGLEPGDYLLTLERKGFAEISLDNISVFKDQKTIANYKYNLLDLTGIEGSITIDGEAPSLFRIKIFDNSGEILSSFRSSPNTRVYSIRLQKSGQYKIVCSAFSPAGKKYYIEKIVEVIDKKTVVLNITF